jgi:hypothetical protein
MNQNLDEFYKHQVEGESSCDEENLPSVQHQFDNKEVLRHQGGGKRDIVAELNRDYNMRKGKIDDEGKIGILPMAPSLKTRVFKRNLI